jgi:hypothetical protein
MLLKRTNNNDKSDAIGRKKNFCHFFLKIFFFLKKKGKDTFFSGS